MYSHDGGGLAGVFLLRLDDKVIDGLGHLAALERVDLVAKVGEIHLTLELAVLEAAGWVGEMSAGRSVA